MTEKQAEINKSSSGINNSELYTVSLYDVGTGRTIPIRSIQDSLMLAKTGENVVDNGAIIYNHTVPSRLLDTFITDSNENFNAKSCVEAIGLYNTDYIRQQVTTLGDKNIDLGQMEDRGALNDLTFRNYIKGGAAPRDDTGKPADTTEKMSASYTRVAENLGIGLGESFVLNPTFQFNKRDDPRTNPMYPKIGRVYSTQIMNSWPIILFQPGRFKYNTGFIKMLGLGGGAGLSEALIRSGGEGIKGAFLKLLNHLGDIASIIGTAGSAIFGGSKIIEFKQTINLFNNYLSMILMQVAGLMGLYNEKNGGYVGEVKSLDLLHILPTIHMGGGPLKYYNEQFIPFRCQQQMVGAETFTNNTQSNPLMEELNSQASQADEGNANKSFMDRLKEMGMKALGNFSDRAAVLAGRGRVTLPDVFESSSFSRSITCSFEFHYPYGDSFGKFENEYLQFLTLLTMGVNRQTGKMTYTSPFAVRVFIKNQILINCGMIESISVTRGGDNNDWCPDGHPKTLKVDVNIKDLEPNISLPLATRGPLRMALEVMFPSSGMSEYLSTIAGLPLDELTHNYRKGHFKRGWQMFSNAWSAKLDPDAIMAGVANTRPGSAIIGLFANMDLDRYNNLANANVIDAEAMANSTMQVKFATPQMMANNNSKLANPESGFAGIKAIENENLAALQEIEKESNQSSYS